MKIGPFFIIHYSCQWNIFSLIKQTTVRNKHMPVLFMQEIWRWLCGIFPKLYVCMSLVCTALLALDFVNMQSIPPAIRRRVLVGWQVFDSQCRGASRGRQMCLRLPTAQTHCWCLYSVKQNGRETQTRMGRERERARERFRTCTECMMGSGSRGWSAWMCLSLRQGSPFAVSFFWGLSEICEMTARLSNIVLMAIRGRDL